MLNKNIIIRSDYITLAQLLKFGNVINTGGEAKLFLATNTIKVNDIVDNRRGRKLYAGDTVIINDELCLTLKKE